MLDARTSGRRGPFASDSGMEDLFRGAGLTDVRTVGGQVEARFDDPEHFLRFSWSHGQRAMWEAVPEADRPALRAEVVDTLEAMRDGAGHLTFVQHVRHTLGARA
jgi:hypothetical protein